MREVTRVLRDSIKFSLDNRKEAVEYALRFGRGLDSNTADEFVGMYVNDWTLDYGDRGREAIRRFLGEGAEKGYIDFGGDVEFVEPS